MAGGREKRESAREFLRRVKETLRETFSPRSRQPALIPIPVEREPFDRS